MIEDFSGKACLMLEFLLMPVVPLHYYEIIKSFVEAIYD